MTREIPIKPAELAVSSHRVPKHWIDKLDAEWVDIWNAQGGYHCQAEQVSIEQVRRDPKHYSFVYPTWAGEKTFLSSLQDARAKA
jgi:hypothetical protein